LIKFRLDLATRRREVAEGRPDTLGVLLDDLIESIDGLLGLAVLLEVALACVEGSTSRRWRGAPEL